MKRAHGKRHGAKAPEAACMIEAGSRTYCVYPLDEVFGVLGRKWTLLLVGALGNTARLRFNELEDLLPGVSPRVLTDRLKQLEGLGLVARTEYDEAPARVEYELTSAGRDLRENLLPLLRWAEGWSGRHDRNPGEGSQRPPTARRAAAPDMAPEPLDGESHP